MDSHGKFLLQLYLDFQYRRLDRLEVHRVIPVLCKGVKIGRDHRVLIQKPKRLTPHLVGKHKNNIRPPRRGKHSRPRQNPNNRRSDCPEKLSPAQIRSCMRAFALGGVTYLDTVLSSFFFNPACSTFPGFQRETRRCLQALRFALKLVFPSHARPVSQCGSIRVHRLYGCAGAGRRT